MQVRAFERYIPLNKHAFQRIVSYQTADNRIIFSLWNGISHHYQLEQLISVLRDVGWYF